MFIRRIVELKLSGIGCCGCGCERPFPRVLVLCPTSLVSVWVQEFAKHLVVPSPLRIHVYDGHPTMDFIKADVVIATMDRPRMELKSLGLLGEQLLDTGSTEQHRRSTLLSMHGLAGCVDRKTMCVCWPFAQAGLYAEHWCYVGVDEAHELRAVQSGRSRAICSYLSTRFFAFFSGTMMQNSAADLVASLIALRDPELMAQRIVDRRSVMQIAAPWTITRRGQQLLRENPRLVQENPALAYLELPRVLSKFSRRFSSDAERALHGACVARLKTVLAVIGDVGHQDVPPQCDPTQAARVALELLLRARQICIAPCLADPSLWDSADQAMNVRSTKMNLLRDYLARVGASELRSEDPAKRTKLLVFSGFVRALELAARVLDELGYEHRTLHGQLRTNQRDRVKREFCEDRSVQVLLCQTKVGGFGHTFTVASRVLHLDAWFNPAVEDQSTMRAYRIGQTRPVIVTRLAISDSVEEFVLDIAEGKRQRALEFDAATSDSRSGKVTMEQVREGIQRMEASAPIEVDDERERHADQEAAAVLNRACRLALAAEPEPKRRRAASVGGRRLIQMTAAFAAASGGSVPRGAVIWKIRRGRGPAVHYDNWMVPYEIAAAGALEDLADELLGEEASGEPKRAILELFAATEAFDLPAPPAGGGSCFFALYAAAWEDMEAARACAKLEVQDPTAFLRAAAAGFLASPLARGLRLSAISRSPVMATALAIPQRDSPESLAAAVSAVLPDSLPPADGTPETAQDCSGSDYCEYTATAVLPFLSSSPRAACAAMAAFFLSPLPSDDRFVFVRRDSSGKGLSLCAAVRSRGAAAVSIAVLGVHGRASPEIERELEARLSRWEEEAADLPLVVIGGSWETARRQRMAAPEAIHALAALAASDPSLPPLGSAGGFGPVKGCSITCPCLWPRGSASFYEKRQ